MARSKIVQVLITLAVTAAMISSCAEKKKSKKTTDPGPGEQPTYSASLVFPMSSSASLSLTGEDSSTVEVITFDKDGNETDKYSAPVKTDAEGISSVDLKVNPSEITTVERENLGVVIQATGEKPSAEIQRPFTPSGKNVIDAIKAIPPERRPFVDPEIMATVLPPEIKFDPATMKDMVLALTEKVRELPEGKRAELFLNRLEQKIDYKEIAKARGNFDNAQAAEAAVGRKVFIERNPELAQKPVVRFLEKPSELIEKDQTFTDKIPDAVREKISGEALARQILARQVSVANRALKTEEIIEMTDAMADVKAAVFIARRGADVGSKESMVSVIDTISKRIEKTEKSEDIKSEVLFAVLMNVPELSDSFEAKREEIADSMCPQALELLVNSKTGECREARDGCEAMNLKKFGWRLPQTKSECFKWADTPPPPPPPTSCAKVEAKMFNPRTQECQIAPDSCVEEKLATYGWRDHLPGDTCAEPQANQRICLQYMSNWQKDGQCKFARNSCEAVDLEKLGFRKVAAEDCSEDESVEVLPPIEPNSITAPTVCAPIGQIIMVNSERHTCEKVRRSCDEFRLRGEGFVSTRLQECPPPPNTSGSTPGSTTMNTTILR